MFNEGEKTGFRPARIQVGEQNVLPKIVELGYSELDADRITGYIVDGITNLTTFQNKLRDKNADVWLAQRGHDAAQSLGLPLPRTQSRAHTSSTSSSVFCCNTPPNSETRRDSLSSIAATPVMPVRTKPMTWSDAPTLNTPTSDSLADMSKKLSKRERRSIAKKVCCRAALRHVTAKMTIAVDETELGIVIKNFTVCHANRTKASSRYNPYLGSQPDHPRQITAGHKQTGE